MYVLILNFIATWLRSSIFIPPPPMTMASKASDIPSHDQSEIIRQLADFPQDIWGDRFNTFTFNKQVYDEYSKEIEILKEEVRSMLMVTDSTVTEKLNLIDIIERLGISYHFVEEIEQQLEEIFLLHTNFDQHQQNYDLFAASLHFRLMRQHGFHISSGIFNQFMDANGKFKESLTTDIKGLLSLYEAAQVMTHGDNILEEALAFTTVNLKCGGIHASSNLAKQVKYALKQALHKGIPRIEARRYISLYEEDESHNQLLLRLAKLDYTSLQMLHKQELSDLIRWEKEIELVSQHPYARARVVESYFAALAAFFEPQYSLGRIILAKIVVLVTVVDDTIDAYGTLHEIKSYTDAIERWDTNEIDELPRYMRSSYLALLNLSDELEKELTEQGRSYAFEKYKEAWIQYAKTSYIETRWFVTRELPSFPDYLRNGLITSLIYVLISTAFLAMETATEDVFNWLSGNPKIAIASAKIIRLSDDVASYEREKQRSATGVECYMKYYNVSEQEAMEKFEEIVGNAWKDINEELLNPATMPREILMRFLNLARLVDVLYKHREDGFTNPHKVIEPHIIALLVDPITV